MKGGFEAVLERIPENKCGEAISELERTILQKLDGDEEDDLTRVPVLVDEEECLIALLRYRLRRMEEC